MALSFSPDGALIAAGTQLGSVRLLDASSGAVRLSLRPHASAVHRLRFSSDGRTLASASNDRSVHLLDAKTGSESASFKDLDGPATGAALSRDDKRLAVALKLVDVTDVEERTAEGKRVHKRPAGPFGRVVVFDVTGRKELQRKDLDAVPTDLAFLPDGNVLAVGTREGPVLLLDQRTGDVRGSLGGPSEVHQLALARDGANVYAAAGVAVYGWTTAGATLFRHLVPGGNFVSVDASADGADVAAANSFGKAVLVLRAGTGDVKATISHDPMPLSVAFSPDGKTLASGAADGKVRFWNPRTGSPL
jgi:WD40 repeat protein